MESKRKRIKIECLDCGSVFNNDYKLKHERDVHKGKKLKHNTLVLQATRLQHRNQKKISNW